MSNAYDAFIQVARERFEAIDTKQAEKSRDALRAPSHLLGHLAWSRGVDYWGEWSDDVKRQIINQNPANLRIRGTRQAINTALAPFAAELVIEEWWEQDPVGDAGTATATVSLGASIGLDADVQELIVRLLKRESRKSVHWDLVIGISGFCAIGDEARARVTSLYQFSGVQSGA